MQSFRRFDRSTTLFVGLLVVSFLLATFDVRSQGEGVGNVMRDGAQSLFSPLQDFAVAVTRPLVGFVDGVSNIAGLRDENERLQERVIELEALVGNAEQLERRVEELERSLQLDPPDDLAAVSARITALGNSAFDQVRFIDKGSEAGIVKGQAVIDENGLVGRIDFVSNGSARVRLITDPQSGVGVRDVATNETGWIEGQGLDFPQLKMFNALEEVTAGDRLFTAGGRYPPGILVGTVRSTAESEAGFALITDVVPAIELSRLDYVKVIVGWSPLDADVDDTGTVTTTTQPPSDPAGVEGQ
jgi:rod shape-determining protein MreC